MPDFWSGQSFEEWVRAACGCAVDCCGVGDGYGCATVGGEAALGSESGVVVVVVVVAGAGDCWFCRFDWGSRVFDGGFGWRGVCQWGV